MLLCKITVAIKFIDNLKLLHEWWFFGSSNTWFWSLLMHLLILKWWYYFFTRLFWILASWLLTKEILLKWTIISLHGQYHICTFIYQMWHWIVGTQHPLICFLQFYLFSVTSVIFSFLNIEGSNIFSSTFINREYQWIYIKYCWLCSWFNWLGVFILWHWVSIILMWCI